ncbi:carbohydrate ABC transporter permease [Cohnella sp. WQ 127256]|uniref:carbohydrate ABC transporter permease n=1 Tax=Cohnella sp. WQ 127256 TaxID=2938790 RepID=UPI0021191EA3|nr:sugar ABC transporter permease [Cohnella sp. WQ 127256]
MHKNRYTAFVFVAPILIFFFVFLLYPLLYTFHISFYEWNGIDPIKKFIGFDNYKSMFYDPLFYQSLRNFLVLCVLVITIQMLLGFLLAYIMRRNSKLFTVFKTIIFIPVILTAIVVSNIFNNILAFNDGLINTILRNIGLDQLAMSWTANPNIALFSVIAVVIWMGTGFSMSVYVSAMTSLSLEVIEASRIDGANRVQTITRVVWPMLRDTHFSLTIISVISALKIFDIVYLLTRGGPMHSTEMLSTYMFTRTFDSYEQGFGSAIGSFLIVLAVVITIIQMRLSRNIQN